MAVISVAKTSIGSFWTLRCIFFTTPKTHKTFCFGSCPIGVFFSLSFIKDAEFALSWPRSPMCDVVSSSFALCLFRPCALNTAFPNQAKTPSTPCNPSQQCFAAGAVPFWGHHYLQPFILSNTPQTHLLIRCFAASATSRNSGST